MLVSWDPFSFAYVQLARGLPVTAPLSAGSFAALLEGNPPYPPWLREIPYPLPANAAFQGQRIRVFEITAPQQPEDQLVRTAANWIELGHPEAARLFQPALSALEHSLPALAVLARVQEERGDDAGVEATMRRIEAEPLPPAGLEPEDQVRLAVALTIGGRLAAARQVLERCTRQLDERTLRHLSAGTLFDLLALEGHFRIALPDPTLRALAAELLPPNLR